MGASHERLLFLQSSLHLSAFVTRKYVKQSDDCCHCMVGRLQVRTPVPTRGPGGWMEPH